MTRSASANPIRPFLDRQGLMILDGGLATELEARGADLGTVLWSARLLADDPALVRQVHMDYLQAGADCTVAASYQASPSGFMEAGYTLQEAEELLRSSVALAVEARDRFWSEKRNREGRIRPLVAASIGPYGACLADGSEYTGAYDLDEDGLYRFHEHRWRLLAGAGADLLACETIPSMSETASLGRLMEECPGPGAWFSFSCCDGRTLRDGGELSEAVGLVSSITGVVGVGVNCVDPALAPEMIATVRAHSSLPVVVYPNSGEQWDGSRRCWTGRPVPLQARQWVDAGASLIGGCCRVGPEEIRRLRGELLPAP